MCHQLAIHIRDGLDFETPRYPKHYAQCLRADAADHKKILIIQDNFLASIAHASSKKVGEKAFFKENENKLVKLFYFEET